MALWILIHIAKLRQISLANAILEGGLSIWESYYNGKRFTGGLRLENVQTGNQTHTPNSLNRQS